VSPIPNVKKILIGITMIVCEKCHLKSNFFMTLNTMGYQLSFLVYYVLY
jgi:hypothetical protein